MDRDGCVVLMAGTHAEERVVPLDVAIFQGKDYVNFFLLNGPQNLPKALRARSEGYGVLHFVEAAVSDVAENFVRGIDYLRGFDLLSQSINQGLPIPRRHARPVSHGFSEGGLLLRRR